MKKIIKKFILFLLLILATNFIFIIINSHLVSKCYPVLNSDVHGIIVGDSHALDGVDMEQVDGLKNFSHFADNWFVTYQKVKFFVDKYPDIQTIITSVSPARFAYSNDLVMLNADSSDEFYNRLYPIINLFEINDFETNYFSAFLIYMRKMGFVNIDYVKNYLYLKFGWFKEHYPYYCEQAFGHHILKTHRKLNYEKVISKTFLEYEGAFSKIDISYIDSLCQLADRQCVNIVFIEFPLPEKYENLLPDNVRNYYDLKILDLTNRKGINFIKYTSTFKDSCFLDEVHLNYKGSQYFTKYLKSNYPDIFTTN